MSVAFFCVLIASLLPILWVGVAKVSGGFRLKDNANPREMLAKVEGLSKRAKWAQENSWEAFAPFAAAVIIAHYCQVPEEQLNLIAISFIGFRLLYGITYIFDKPTIRSIVWSFGMACNFLLYYLSWTQSS